MKILAALVAAVALSAGCVSTHSSSTSKLPGPINLASTDAVVMTVHGLSCPLCSNNLDGQLKKIWGVKDSTIDLKTGAVTVTFEPNHSVTSEDLAKAVKQAGFTLKAIEPKASNE
jgi:copper chaperone CopZ